MVTGVNMEQASRFREYIRQMECHLENMSLDDCNCCGINRSQCFVVVEIGRKPGISLKEVAEILHTEKSCMSRTVDSLVKKGYVDRRISTKDRRYVMLDLTEKGRKHFERIEKDMTDLFEKVLLGIPEKKRNQVMESIKLFNDACLEIEAAEKTK